MKNVIWLLILLLSSRALAQSGSFVVDDHRDADRRVSDSPALIGSLTSSNMWIMSNPYPDIRVNAGGKETMVLKANGQVWINGEKMKSNREFYFKFKRLLNGVCP